MYFDGLKLKIEYSFDKMLIIWLHLFVVSNSYAHPIIINTYLGREIPTLILFLSSINPISLVRTVENIIISFSCP